MGAASTQNETLAATSGRFKGLFVCHCLLERTRISFVTKDETWPHHFTPQSERQPAKWRAAGVGHLKGPKTQQSAGQAQTSVVLDAQIKYNLHRPP